MGHSLKLFYLDDIPTPYRTDVFEKINQKWQGEFSIGFCAESEPGRKFDLDLSSLNAEILPGYQWRPHGQVNPFSIKWSPGIADTLDRFAPDVVVLSGYTHPTMMRAARWCINSNVPYAVACETSEKSTTTNGARWVARRLLSSWIVRNMAFGLPVGSEAANYLKMFGPSDAPMYDFPNTPDTKVFSDAADEMKSDSELEAAVRAKHGLRPGSLLFTFVGRLIEAKRPLDAIRAFKRLPKTYDCSLVIVGDGPLMDEVKQEVLSDSRIIATGWLSEKAEIANLLAVSSVFLLPSTHEPWGAVVNEAMAGGNCVIGTEKVGAAAELIKSGKNGFVVPVADIEAISKTMLELASNPQLIAEIGEQAQITAATKGADFASRNLIEGALKAVTGERL